MELSEADPKGLVRESYAMEGISAGECRSIFMDWALSLADGADPVPPILHLLEFYGKAAPEHPMTDVLRAGLKTPEPPRRRGGRIGRGQGF